MARIVFTWEIGGGLGHFVEMQPLAHALADQGHEVFAVLRDLTRAAAILGGKGLRFLQAPYKQSYSNRAFHPAHTFAHILHNVGFEDAKELGTRVAAWRQLFDWIQPDLLIFDHSPTAMLAARNRPCAKALLSSSFFCPVLSHPTASFRPWEKIPPDKLAAADDQILNCINTVLNGAGLPPLNSIAQLYADIDETFLITFEELDFYRKERPAQTSYFGAWPFDHGLPPKWPSGAGPKIYAYLKPFRTLPALIENLHRRGHPTLIVGDGLPLELQTRFQSPTLQFANEPLDLWQVSRECDLAILNGGHGVTAAMLLAGKPMLQVPLLIEQAWNGKACIDLGIGLSANPTDPDLMLRKLHRLLTTDDFNRKSQGIACKYADFDPASQISRMLVRAEQLLCGPRSATVDAGI